MQYNYQIDLVRQIYFTSLSITNRGKILQKKKLPCYPEHSFPVILCTYSWLGERFMKLIRYFKTKMSP